MPFRIVRDFEAEIADWAGAKYGVAVESCSAAIFLACLYRRVRETTIPRRTYPSVPCAIIHAGGSVHYHDDPWEGLYELQPWRIWDGALRFRQGMYAGGLHCLSFHVKKHLKIGRGGMILSDDLVAVRWLRRARFDGRDECDLSEQDRFTMLGWNMYMTPEQAARGLLLFRFLQHHDLPDLSVAAQGYPDLSQSGIFSQAEKCNW